MRRYLFKIAGIVGIVFFAATPLRGEERETQATQKNASEISIASLNALKLLESRISAFGETSLYHKPALLPLPSDIANSQPVQGVRFGLVTMYPPEESILVTIERIGQAPPTLRVQQGFGIPQSGGKSFEPAPVSQERTLKIDDFVALMDRFEAFGTCNYPIDNDYGNDGFWRFVEFLDSDRYCFAVRWGGKSEELVDFGEELILDLGIRD